MMHMIAVNTCKQTKPANNSYKMLTGLLMILLGFGLSGCFCMHFHDRYIDWSVLGDDVVSLILKDRYENFKPWKERNKKRLNDFFSRYNTENDIIEYFEQIGGECTKSYGDNIAKCLLDREMPAYTRESSCDEYNFDLMERNTIEIKFHKVNGIFLFEYDREFSTPGLYNNLKIKRSKEDGK